jgi:integrase
MRLQTFRILADLQKARRPKNADVRTREYLTEREVEQLIEGCRGNRWPHRDQTMILIAFRHGLRASELCDLQWTQVDFEAATLAVTRAKHGTPSTHPLTGRELRALRRLHREAEGRSPFLFVSERGSPMTVSNFQKLVSRATEAAGLEIKTHPHMLRHACGHQSLTRGSRWLSRLYQECASDDWK